MAVKLAASSVLPYASAPESGRNVRSLAALPGLKGFDWRSPESEGLSLTKPVRAAEWVARYSTVASRHDVPLDTRKLTWSSAMHR
jgi:hypothetical protein